MSTLKERFAEIQDEKPGISQADLMRATGAKAASVNDWFSGKTKTMKIDTASKAAPLYGVSALWLAKGEGPKVGPTIQGPLSDVALMEAHLQLQVRQIAILLNAIPAERRNTAYSAVTDLLITYLHSPQASV